ncbi:MAG: cyclic nucleotide-binding domain-containing protein, partial [Gemmatimonadetes bacterium]|nr:cyclic nucleotide-binding domain-containing protein [Gemmatimonadota bacterium]
ALEVKAGDEVVAVRSAGDVIGEIAFFMELPRTMDVVAATDDVEQASDEMGPETPAKQKIDTHRPGARLAMSLGTPRTVPTSSGAMHHPDAGYRAPSLPPPRA